MPIYEYVCLSCGADTEVIQRFSDPPLETCKACSGKLEKKISSSAFHLKGTGWYKTDYAGKSSGSNGSTTDGKSKSEDTGASSATETSTAKPAESSAPKSDSSTKDA